MLLHWLFYTFGVVYITCFTFVGIYMSFHVGTYVVVAFAGFFFESSMVAGWRREFDIASWGWSRLEFTDASVGLRL